MRTHARASPCDTAAFVSFLIALLPVLWCGCTNVSGFPVGLRVRRWAFPSLALRGDLAPPPLDETHSPQMPRRVRQGQLRRRPTVGAAPAAGLLLGLPPLARVRLQGVATHPPARAAGVDAAVVRDHGAGTLFVCLCRFWVWAAYAHTCTNCHNHPRAHPQVVPAPGADEVVQHCGGLVALLPLYRLSAVPPLEALLLGQGSAGKGGGGGGDGGGGDTASAVSGDTASAGRAAARGALQAPQMAPQPGAALSLAAPAGVIEGVLAPGGGAVSFPVAAYTAVRDRLSAPGWGLPLPLLAHGGGVPGSTLRALQCVLEPGWVGCGLGCHGMLPEGGRNLVVTVSVHPSFYSMDLCITAPNRPIHS